MASRLGTTRTNYKNWEYGQSSPGRTTMALAQSLIELENESVGVLKNAEIPEHIRSLMSGDIAVLPAWRAQGGIIGDEEFSFEQEDADLPIGVPAFFCTPGPIEKYRAVAISGYSMSPRIESGAIVVVRMVDDPTNGLITIVQSEAGRLFVKTFRRDALGNPELHSINGKYPPINAMQLRGWRVRAVACGILHAYEPGRPNIEWDSGRPLRA